MMVGREVLLRVNKTPAHPGPVILHVENLHALSDRGLEVLHGVSFDVRSGEILGIAGVEGNGQSELVEALTGMRKTTSGKVTITQVKNGQVVKTRDLTTLDAREEREFGLAHIPEDRRGSGLVLSDTIEDNTILGRQHWPQFSWNISDHVRVNPANADLLLVSTMLPKPAPGTPADPRTGLGGGFFLYEVRSKRRVLLCPPNLYAKDAEWSRDGIQIFFTGRESTRGDATYRIFWDGSEPKRYLAGTDFVVGQ
jgi:simple sugar transport system ATP-binding protein